jgi:sugar/nucleoside kinase (ribokinase family)
MNLREACLLAGTADLGNIGQALLPRRRADALLIIRDGPRGCFLFGADITGAPLHIPAPPVRMLDSTGAGDTHTGVFIAAMAAGLDVISAATRANAAAAISVTSRGPATAPTSEELDAFLTRWPQCRFPARAKTRPNEPATVNNREA